MRRRTLLQTVGTGVTGLGSGCLGGGKVVVTVSRSVSVDPGNGWVKKIPDVSDPGGVISYTIRSDQSPFDVYFFIGTQQFEQYQAFIGGNEPSKTPRGDSSLSKAAVPTSDETDIYQAQTTDGGARESLDATGPYYFVVDYSNYRMENRVERTADPLSAFVDLEIVRNNVGL